MQTKLANGVTGHLLYTADGTYRFRVYGENYTFVDYKLHHCDLMVTIVDPDSAFYHYEDGDILDHAQTTLGIENGTAQ
jgi:hypothetical protein